MEALAIEVPDSSWVSYLTWFEMCSRGSWNKLDAKWKIQHFPSKIVYGKATDNKKQAQA